MSKMTYKDKSPFSVEELNQLRQAAKDLQIRDSIILDLLIDHGLRPVDIVSINKDDVYLKEKTIILNENGYKREIFISQDLADKIVMMISHKEYITWKNNALFMGASHKRIGRCAIDKMLKKLAESTGIENLYPQRLRLTFYSSNIEEFGGDLMKVVHI